MDSIDQSILPLAESSPGRCHSCVNQQSYDLPSGTRYWCRAFGTEMNQAERDAVRNCERWLPFRPIDSQSRVKRSLLNPLFAEVIEQEDRLLWEVKESLDLIGVDLKSLLVVSQSTLTAVEQVDWVDQLDARFGGETARAIGEVLRDLRALGYHLLCDMVERVTVQSTGWNGTHGA